MRDVSKYDVSYITVVGSHAWNMEHEGSDWDYWRVYQAPSESFLMGEQHHKGHQVSGTNIDEDTGEMYKWDCESHEIGKHIQMLLKGNVNHVVGLFGHGVRVVPTRKFMHRGGAGTWMNAQSKLRDLYKENPAKNVYHSINGLTSSNLRTYFERRGQSKYLPIDDEHLPMRCKKLGQIERMIRFGFRILTDGEISLEPVEVKGGGLHDEERVRWWQEQLTKAYHYSDLPENPDAAPFKEFLMKLRRDDLE
jgi:hypothetical protein